jgi:hypothetical protein
MPKKTPRTAPFLLKLYNICSTIPGEIGSWNGAEFEVYDPDRFFEFLTAYYTGSQKTFLRQLSYFSFTKREILPKGFAFYHESFQKNELQRLGNIRRRTTASTATDVASNDDEEESESPYHRQQYPSVLRLESAVSQLQHQVTELTRTVELIVSELKRTADFDVLGLAVRHSPNEQSPAAQNKRLCQIERYESPELDTNTLYTYLEEMPQTAQVLQLSGPIFHPPYPPSQVFRRL